jgi:hypothetical protein
VRGTIAHTSVSGVNRLRFNGRLAGRRLRLAHYRLRATARDSAGNRSAKQAASFTIQR